ncbi:uncharacterized protein LOC132165040 [Corylus avellana]|uniref:uncharacterized protein LOC132165040 n=1 Tax=Corylus avellana TaxID=13451 RepID=UPI00286B3D93|nr:uncharacterized protein LOC132165040 [Corylus avellana]
MGFGVVVRDHEGLVCAALSKTMDGCPDPTTAEAMGALCAMEFCRDLGLQDLILEGDSKVVVMALKNTGPNWCSYGQVISDIVEVAHGFRSWTVEHVSREDNYAAHKMGQRAVQGRVLYSCPHFGSKLADMPC